MLFYNIQQMSVTYKNVQMYKCLTNVKNNKS